MCFLYTLYRVYSLIGFYILKIRENLYMLLCGQFHKAFEKKVGGDYSERKLLDFHHWRHT